MINPWSLHGRPKSSNLRAVSKTGYTIPYALFANTLIAIGCGLLSRLGPDTPTVAWAGYQVIAGFGRGAGMQMV